MLVASGQRSHAASQRFYWHRHAFHELGIVLSGEADWRLGKTTRRTLKTGQAILLKPGTLHCEEMRPGKKCAFAWLGFETACTTPSWAHRVISLADDFGEVSDSFQIITREHRRDDPLSVLRLQMALQSILLLMARQAESEESSAQPEAIPSALNARQLRCVESAAHYFTENLRDPLSIAQVAAYHSLGSAHFSKLFRRHYGRPPRTFLHEARMRKSKELLLKPELPVKEIAMLCGFVDSAHFCKVFKTETGTTPKQFRARR
jgi:AraC-like DNA-binding protein